MKVNGNEISIKVEPTTGIQPGDHWQIRRVSEVITDPARLSEAQVVLDVLTDQREKVVLSYNSSGQVRENQLRIRFRFRLRTLAGKELIPESEILQQRDITFNETIALSKEAEEALLYRDMQSDIVQQMLRRLAAVKNLD